MGRPLKIAKAQILTLTAVDGTNEYVTVSEDLNDLNVIANMPFVVATTTGGLTAGTTYWILEVLTANTFTVSNTPISANPTLTPRNLTTAGPVSVKVSVGIVDSGFSNPDGSNTATNSTSYGVVGGNTSIYGSQVLAQVAIGINGTGTIYTSDADANVFGIGTDFANLTVGAALQVAVANNNGTTDYVNLGFISSVTGLANIEISNATATGDFLTATNSDATDLIEDGAIVLTANIGGLVAGEVYFVGTIANADAFSVSLTPGGANVALSDENATSYALQDNLVLGASGAVTASGANFVYANDEAGFIVRQKGKNKYLVTGGTTGITAICTTANVANTALTPNTMSIIGTYANSSTTYVQSVNDYQSQVFATTVAAGSLVAGTQYTIYSSGTTNWTSVGAASNMTGVTFTATGAGSGTGTAIAITANPDIIATFGTAYAANTYGGQPNPIVTINNA